MLSEHEHLHLAFGFSFEDLYSRDGLVRLDAAFLEYAESSNAGLFQRLGEARANPGALAPKQNSELIVELAPLVEDLSPSCSASRAQRARSKPGMRFWGRSTPSRESSCRRRPSAV